MTIAEILDKKIRKEKIITQVELARRMNVSLVAVGKWLKGGSIDIGKIPALCKILGITPNMLFGFEDSETLQALALYDAYKKHPEYSEAIKKLLEIEE